MDLSQHAVAFSFFENAYQMKYQLQFDLVSRQPVSMNASISGRNSTANLTCEDIARRASELGYQRSLMVWILHNGLKDMRSLRAVRSNIKSLHLPVSLADLKCELFCQELIGIVRSAGLAAHTICLEISERDPLAECTKTANNIRRLMVYGLGIVLANFGGGRNGLHYLLKLPIAGLKLDPVFAQKIQQRKTYVLVEMVARSCEKMGIRFIADGITGAWQYDLFKDFGAHNGQGEWYHKAQPFDELFKSVLAKTPRSTIWDEPEPWLHNEHPSRSGTQS